MINKDFFAALEDLEKEKKIDKEAFIEALEAGLVSAVKKETGEARQVSVKLNPEKCTIKVYAFREVVEEVVDFEKEISLEEAKEIKASSKVGDLLTEDITPKEMSRIAAQTAIQVIKQRINDKKKTQVIEEMNKKEGEILNAIVRRVEGDNVYVEMVGSQLEGIMMANDQVKGEIYRVNDVIKVYVKSIQQNSLKGSSRVVVSRASAGFVKRLFEFECPELKAGLVVVKHIVREAGLRTKIAVYTEDSNIDAVGALIGQKGMRINAIVQELGGEKIDIVGYCEDPVDFIARALTPAKVLMVQIGEDGKSARAIVPDDKLSLAIGRAGHNVKLAAKLTGWKIDVKPYSTVIAELESFSAEEAEEGGTDESVVAESVVADEIVVADETVAATDAE